MIMNIMQIKKIMVQTIKYPTWGILGNFTLNKYQPPVSISAENTRMKCPIYYAFCFGAFKKKSAAYLPRFKMGCVYFHMQ